MADTTARSDAIRQWLLKKPRPNTVRVTSVAGEVSDVKIAENPRWRDVADTIDSLDPASIHAFDNEGNVLRAEKLADVPEQDDLEPQAVPVPGVLHSDPETARMNHFGALLAEAYRHANTVAFDRMIDLVDRMNTRAELQEQRMERLESAYQAEMHARFQEQLAAAQEANQGGEDGILSSFLGGAKAGRETNGAAAPRGFQKTKGGEA